MINYKYAKLEDGIITYAKATVRIGNVVYANPTDEQYKKGGWYKYIDVQPEFPEADEDGRPREIAFSGYTVDDENKTITKNYIVITLEKPAFNISKLKLMIALTKVGIWEQFKSWLQDSQVQIEDGISVNCWDAYIQAQVLSTDNPMFSEYLELAKKQFSNYLTSKQIDYILQTCKE